MQLYKYTDLSHMHPFRSHPNVSHPRRPRRAGRSVHRSRLLHQYVQLSMTQASTGDVEISEPVARADALHEPGPEVGRAALLSKLCEGGRERVEG